MKIYNITNIYFSQKMIKNIEKNCVNIEAKLHMLIRSHLELLCVVFAGIILSANLTGCNNSHDESNKEVDMKVDLLPISDTIRQALSKIKDKKIVFAHHSVGGNLLDGIESLAKEVGVKFSVDNLESVSLGNQNAFIEFTPGKNQQPYTKVDGFVEQLEKLNQEFIPDVAFMKFCFIDFSPETNVDKVFNYYKKNIEKLKNKKSRTLFVHFTVPLMESPNDIKSRIKRFLGRDVWVDTSNVTRAKFNELLFKSFPNDPIFDIAKFESTRLDGNRQTFSYKGKTYYSLISEYTDDGSHLNKFGQRFVALEFVKFIAATI